MRSIQSELREKGFVQEHKQDYQKKNTPKSEINVRCDENLTTDELRSLMGEFRPTFSRGRGGAYRQR